MVVNRFSPKGRKEELYRPVGLPLLRDKDETCLFFFSTTGGEASKTAGEGGGEERELQQSKPVGKKRSAISLVDAKSSRRCTTPWKEGGKEVLAMLIGGYRAPTSRGGRRGNQFSRGRRIMERGERGEESGIIPCVGDKKEVKHASLEEKEKCKKKTDHNRKRGKKKGERLSDREEEGKGHAFKSNRGGGKRDDVYFISEARVTFTVKRGGGLEQGILGEAGWKRSFPPGRRETWLASGDLGEENSQTKKKGKRKDRSPPARPWEKKEKRPRRSRSGTTAILRVVGEEETTGSQKEKKGGNTHPDTKKGHRLLRGANTKRRVVHNSRRQEEGSANVERGGWSVSQC